MLIQKDRVTLQRFIQSWENILFRKQQEITFNKNIKR